jgi:hypothetical protein
MSQSIQVTWGDIIEVFCESEVSWIGRGFHSLVELWVDPVRWNDSDDTLDQVEVHKVRDWRT